MTAAAKAEERRGKERKRMPFEILAQGMDL
jgi:hypothetical protein